MMSNNQPWGRPIIWWRGQMMEDIQKRKQGKSEGRYKMSSQGRKEKNGEGFIIGQPTLVETSTNDDGGGVGGDNDNDNSYNKTLKKCPL